MICNLFGWHSKCWSCIILKQVNNSQISGSDSQVIGLLFSTGSPGTTVKGVSECCYEYGIVGSAFSITVSIN